jgi:hypothetical protein
MPVVYQRAMQRSSFDNKDDAENKFEVSQSAMDGDS